MSGRAAKIRAAVNFVDDKDVIGSGKTVKDVIVKFADSLD
jgi:hypothetical protein